MLLPILQLGCHAKIEEYKACAYQVDDPNLLVYNDLLIELVEQRFYNLYLGERREELTREIEKNNSPDSTKDLQVRQKAVALQHEQYGDTAYFRTLYLTQQLHHEKELEKLLHIWGMAEPAGEGTRFLNRYGAVVAQQ